MPPSVRTLLLVCALSQAGCANGGVLRAPEPLALPASDRRHLRTGIHAAADYLARACGEDGRFVYRVDLDDGRALGGYNVLRHAGAIYALASYQEHWPDPETAAALARAALYLKAEHVAPLPDERGIAAVWSEPARAGLREAKLGGAGLALVALTALERVAPGSTSRQELSALARFVLFMQRDDGSFYSKYLRSRGRDDSWTSLYYPGEAALGLAMLHELDGEQRWRDAAVAALEQLARAREGQREVPADHWALLATERLLRDGLDPPTELRLLAHGQQIATSMLSTRASHPPGSPLHGCFGDDGRTTPTATRLEGLLATLVMLPEEDGALRRRIAAAAEEGIAFLLRAQEREGLHRGALPRAVDPEVEQAREARIDYAQHALSAFIQYLAL